MEGSGEAMQLVSVTFNGLNMAFRNSMEAAKLAYKFIQYMINLAKYHQSQGLTNFDNLSKHCNGDIKVFSMKKEQFDILSKSLDENGVLFCKAPSLKDKDTVNFFVGTKDLAIVQQCMEDLEKRFIKESVKMGMSEAQAADMFANDNHDIDFNELINNEFGQMSDEEYGKRMSEMFGKDWDKNISSVEIKKDENGNFHLRNDEIDNLVSKARIDIDDATLESRYVMSFAEDEYKMNALRKNGIDTSELSPSNIKDHIVNETDDFALVQLSSLSPMGAWIAKKDIVSLRASSDNNALISKEDEYKDIMNMVIFNNYDKVKVCNINDPSKVHELPVTKAKGDYDTITFSQFKNCHDRMLLSFLSDKENDMKDKLKKFYNKDEYNAVITAIKNNTHFYDYAAKGDKRSADEIRQDEFNENLNGMNFEEFEKKFNNNLNEVFQSSFKR